MHELIRSTAREVVGLLRAGEVSPLELVDLAAARVAETDAALNALPTLCLERARDRARRLPASRTPATEGPGWLGGLPIVVKDLNDVAGVRTTYGSPLFAAHVPDASDAMVETLEANGALIIAKSNTPEFGHGANTFNEVFGATLNPWNTALTCGGSSGGSAVALAAGQAWLATGSDLGCSLRTPAAFCSVVGLRPSPGRVARSRTRLAFDDLWVQGPMARSVGDVALMLDAMSGAHPADPIALPAPASPFSAALAAPPAPLRIAWSPDLGGVTRVAREVADVCADAVGRLSGAQVQVDEACPDFTDAADIFRVLRARQFVGDLGEIIDRHRDAVRPEVVQNLEQGRRIDADALARAERGRSGLFERVSEFMGGYDLLVTPATVVAPFDVAIRAISEVDGYRFESYFDWYAIAYVITLTSLPALSLPCGFTADGRPVALQLVGRPRGEAALLAHAAQLERMLGIAGFVPIDPRLPQERR